MTRGTPSKMAMMSPKRRAEFKLKSMKKMGLKPGDLQKKPGGRPKLTKSQMLLQAQGKDLKGGQLFTGEQKKRIKQPKKFNLGGEAATSVGRATVVKSQREAQRKKLDDMMNRLYGKKSTIKPKKKPKKPTKVKTPKIVKDLRAAGGIKSSDAIKAAIKAMKSKK